MNAGMLSGAYQQTILDAFNSQVYVSDRMDVQHTPLYDTVVLAAGASLSTLSSAFFTNVGPASNKTLALTNMTQSQRLPAPQAFSIFSIQVRWSEDIFDTDLYALLNGFALNLILGQKSYQLGPLWYFAAGGGITGLDTATAQTFYTNGVPSRQAIRTLAIPIVIENQMTFYAQLEGTTTTLTAAENGGTGLTLQVLLDGLYARGVQ